MMKKKTQKAVPAPPHVVYCGPTIEGVINQWQTFIGGVPDYIAAHQLIKTMIVPIDKLPEVRLGLMSGKGKWSALYRKIKEVN